MSDEMTSDELKQMFENFLAEYADRRKDLYRLLLPDDFSLADDPGLDALVTSFAVRFGYPPRFMAEALKLWRLLYPELPLEPLIRDGAD